MVKNYMITIPIRAEFEIYVPSVLDSEKALEEAKRLLTRYRHKHDFGADDIDWSAVSVCETEYPPRGFSLVP